MFGLIGTDRFDNRSVFFAFVKRLFSWFLNDFNNLSEFVVFSPFYFKINNFVIGQLYSKNCR